MVLEKAARAFAERGYHATSMNDLVEATDLAAGGLYHYIGNKEKLLVSIFDMVLGPLADAAEAAVSSGATPRDQLRALLDAWLELAAERRYEMMVVHSEWQTMPDGKEWKAVRAQRRRFEAAVRSVISDLHDDSGRPRNPQIAFMALLAMVNSTPTWLDPDGPFTPSEVADTYFELVGGTAARGRRTSRTKAKAKA